MSAIKKTLCWSIAICCLSSADAQERDVFWFLQMDRLEYQQEEDTWLWDMQGWVGGDEQKLWWKTEGEVDGNDAELQLLYSRAISSYWDLQLGVRHVVEPEPSEYSAVIGIQGLAPQWFEIDAAAFLDENGDLEARLEVEYDLLLTQQLVLQPRIELSSENEKTEFGLRLRYEIRREIAPYVGVSWHDSQGQRGDVSLIAGATFWY